MNENEINSLVQGSLAYLNRTQGAPNTPRRSIYGPTGSSSSNDRFGNRAYGIIGLDRNLEVAKSNESTFENIMQFGLNSAGKVPFKIGQGLAFLGGLAYNVGENLAHYSTPLVSAGLQATTGYVLTNKGAPRGIFESNPIADWFADLDKSVGDYAGVIESEDYSKKGFFNALITEPSTMLSRDLADGVGFALSAIATAGSSAEAQLGIAAAKGLSRVLPQGANLNALAKGVTKLQQVTAMSASEAMFEGKEAGEQYETTLRADRLAGKEYAKNLTDEEIEQKKRKVESNVAAMNMTTLALTNLVELSTFSRVINKAGGKIPTLYDIVDKGDTYTKKAFSGLGVFADKTNLTAKFSMGLAASAVSEPFEESVQHTIQNIYSNPEFSSKYEDTSAAFGEYKDRLLSGEVFDFNDAERSRAMGVGLLTSMAMSPLQFSGKKREVDDYRAGQAAAIDALNNETKKLTNSIWKKDSEGNVVANTDYTNAIERETKSQAGLDFVYDSLTDPTKKEMVNRRKLEKLAKVHFDAGTTDLLRARLSAMGEMMPNEAAKKGIEFTEDPKAESERLIEYVDQLEQIHKTAEKYLLPVNPKIDNARKDAFYAEGSKLLNLERASKDIDATLVDSSRNEVLAAERQVLEAQKQELIKSVGKKSLLLNQLETSKASKRERALGIEDSAFRRNLRDSLIREGEEVGLIETELLRNSKEQAKDPLLFASSVENAKRLGEKMWLDSEIIKTKKAVNAISDPSKGAKAFVDYTNDKLISNWWLREFVPNNATNEEHFQTYMSERTKATAADRLVGQRMSQFVEQDVKENEDSYDLSKIESLTKSLNSFTPLSKETKDVLKRKLDSNKQTVEQEFTAADETAFDTLDPEDYQEWAAKAAKEKEDSLTKLTSLQDKINSAPDPNVSIEDSVVAELTAIESSISDSFLKDPNNFATSIPQDRVDKVLNLARLVPSWYPTLMDLAMTLMQAQRMAIANANSRLAQLQRAEQDKVSAFFTAVRALVDRKIIPAGILDIPKEETTTNYYKVLQDIKQLEDADKLLIRNSLKAYSPKHLGNPRRMLEFSLRDTFNIIHNEGMFLYGDQENKPVGNYFRDFSIAKLSDGLSQYDGDTQKKIKAAIDGYYESSAAKTILNQLDDEGSILAHLGAYKKQFGAKAALPTFEQRSAFLEMRQFFTSSFDTAKSIHANTAYFKGLAGTGKTWITKAVVSSLQLSKEQLLLSGASDKAVQNLSEGIDGTPTSLKSLEEMFANKAVSSDVRVVVIDEAAAVDMNQLERVLFRIYDHNNTTKQGIKVLLLGDPSQIVYGWPVDSAIDTYIDGGTQDLTNLTSLKADGSVRVGNPHHGLRSQREITPLTIKYRSDILPIMLVQDQFNTARTTSVEVAGATDKDVSDPTAVGLAVGKDLVKVISDRADKSNRSFLLITDDPTRYKDAKLPANVEISTPNDAQGLTRDEVYIDVDKSKIQAPKTPHGREAKFNQVMYMSSGRAKYFLYLGNVQGTNTIDNTISNSAEDMAKQKAILVQLEKAFLDSLESNSNSKAETTKETPIVKPEVITPENENETVKNEDPEPEPEVQTPETSETIEDTEEAITTEPILPGEEADIDFVDGWQEDIEDTTKTFVAPISTGDQFVMVHTNNDALSGEAPGFKEIETNSAVELFEVGNNLVFLQRSILGGEGRVVAMISDEQEKKEFLTSAKLSGTIPSLPVNTEKENKNFFGDIDNRVGVKFFVTAHNELQYKYRKENPTPIEDDNTNSNIYNLFDQWAEGMFGVDFREKIDNYKDIKDVKNQDKYFRILHGRRNTVAYKEELAELGITDSKRKSQIKSGVPYLFIRGVRTVTGEPMRTQFIRLDTVKVSLASTQHRREIIDPINAFVKTIKSIEEQFGNMKNPNQPSAEYLLFKQLKLGVGMGMSQTGYFFGGVVTKLADYAIYLKAKKLQAQGLFTDTKWIEKYEKENIRINRNGEEALILTKRVNMWEFVDSKRKEDYDEGHMGTSVPIAALSDKLIEDSYTLNTQLHGEFKLGSTFEKSAYVNEQGEVINEDKPTGRRYQGKSQLAYDRVASGQLVVETEGKRFLTQGAVAFGPEVENESVKEKNKRKKRPYRLRSIPLTGDTRLELIKKGDKFAAPFRPVLTDEIVNKLNAWLKHRPYSNNPENATKGRAERLNIPAKVEVGPGKFLTKEGRVSAVHNIYGYPTSDQLESLFAPEAFDENGDSTANGGFGIRYSENLMGHSTRGDVVRQPLDMRNYSTRFSAIENPSVTLTNAASPDVVTEPILAQEQEPPKTKKKKSISDLFAEAEKRAEKVEAVVDDSFEFLLEEENDIALGEEITKEEAYRIMNTALGEANLGQVRDQAYLNLERSIEKMIRDGKIQKDC